MVSRALLLGILLSTAAAADTVGLLHDARGAAEARVASVVGAREEVFVSSFIVGAEPFSATALALLRGAARQGLDVRLLVDAQWDKTPAAVKAHLLAEGVEIRRYHPFRLAHPTWITKRLHDKLLIVDGRLLILGGRNVEAPYFGLGRQLERRDYLDLDLRVRGRAAAEARRYFLDVWASRHVRPARPRASPREIREAEAALDRHEARIRERIERDGARRPGERPFTTRIGTVRFLHDPASGKGTGPGVGTALERLVDAARHRVVVESAYLIPTRRLRRALARALDRGVEVRILTNSLTTTDNLWAQAGYVGERRELVGMGVGLWEYTGPESVHSKVGILDGRTVVVGSFNLDPRSARLNTEVALVAESEALAGTLRRVLDDRISRSVRLDARGWPVGADEPFPGVARWKVCRLRLLRFLAPLIRTQL